MTWATSDGLSKHGYPPVCSLVRALRSQFKNWFRLAALSWVALPSRCPPRNGWPRLARLPVDVQLRNRLRARCRLDEFAGFLDVWVYREYDAPGIRWGELSTVVDVGANVGAATLWLASRAPQARIVAVEPSPRVIPSLVRNVESNGLADRVQVVPVAVGAASGIGYLRPSRLSVTASVRTMPTPGATSVPIVTLDELLARVGMGTVDLLKLDCEGAELGVLRSSESTSLPSIRAIVGEFHGTNSDGRDELEELLVRAGFECQFVGSENLCLFAAIRPQ